MSLYNMVIGYHPLAGILLGCLDYDNETVSTIPRFRDCYLFQDEIRLLTRTGGGNRQAYEEENEALRQREGFIRDWDDAFDATFAWWAYKWPEDDRENLQKALEAIEKHRPELFPDDLESLFNTAIERVKK